MLAPGMGEWVYKANLFLFGEFAYYYPFFLFILNYVYYKRNYKLANFTRRELFGIGFAFFSSLLLFAVFYPNSGYILELAYAIFSTILGEQYCYSLNTGSFESFFDKILKKQDFKSELEKILDNFNEIALINSLYNSFYRLFKIALYAKINGKIDFKELLGYTPPPQVGQNLSSQAFSLKIEQYKEIFTLLLKSEYELKTNPKLVKKEFLISNLLKLARILKN